MNRILSIVDTRKWDWRKKAPVKGSGDPRPCDHCRTPHEIHVTIELDGRQMVVGSTCAVKLLGRTAQLSSLNLKRALLRQALTGLAARMVAGIETEDETVAWRLAWEMTERSGVGPELWNSLKSRIMIAWHAKRGHQIGRCE